MPDFILVTMATDQHFSCQLVLAAMSGVLPIHLKEIQCRKISHARWLMVYMWTRNHGLAGQGPKTLEVFVKFCLQMYFEFYFDIKVHYRLQNGPKHILTQLRIFNSQPKKVQEAVTFGVWTGATQNENDRRFAVTQILTLRGNEEYGDMSLRPRITSKLNLSATSLHNLITWQPGKVQEPVFTCFLSRDQIKEILIKPYQVLEFSIHTQSTERVVKQMAETAAVVVGQQAREGFIRGRVHHREAIPSFRSKKDIMTMS